MSDSRELVVTLLQNVGSRREIQHYLREFSSVAQARFAVVKVGDRVLDEQLDELSTALSFLHRMGLHPVVVHGAGPQRAVGRKELRAESLRLVDALEARGTRARPISAGVFEAAPVFEPGQVGEVRAVHLDAIEASVASGHLPVIASLGETASGQILTIDIDMAARELAVALRPYKIVFLTAAGGLRDGRGALIDAVNLVEDYDALLAEPWVKGDMRRELVDIKLLLDRLPASSSVSITSPAHLARELFTHRGSGTLVRQGELVRSFERFEDTQVTRLRQLIEHAFEQALAADYFARKTPHRIYLVDSYRAAAIVTREAPAPYLDKFAVTRAAQGAGIGGSLWRHIRRDHPSLFWRSRVGNPINAWYFNNADGAVRSPPWVVFWYGLARSETPDPFARIKRCVERALAMTPTIGTGGISEDDDA